MQSSELGQFKTALQKVFALYDKQLSTILLDVWWEALQPYTLQEVTRALTVHVRNPDTGQYLPKPADVIKALRGTSANTAQSAWTKVDGAVRKVGPHKSVAFDDPIIHRVIQDMGGWIRMNEHTNDEWPFVQREFENRYRGFSVTGEIPEYPRLLMGIAEAHNKREKIRIAADLQEKPALIGDASKAELVISGGESTPLLTITPRLGHDNGTQQTDRPRLN